MEVKKAKVGKISKKDMEFYLVAIVNDSGNVVTGATLLNEVDADATAEMFKVFLNHESIPFKPYEEMLHMTDQFFKKLADDQDPFDDGGDVLHKMPSSQETYRNFCLQMATAIKKKLAEEFSQKMKAEAPADTE